jgi:DNA repair protein RecN (Recombination protein N)
MLLELSITNFAIIDELHLPLAPGFNVLTGETGAGKSIIIDAVSLLVGGKADPGMIRTGADQARIEGIFALDPASQAALAPVFAEYGLDDGSAELILSRDVNASGRSVARVNGRAVPVRVLQELGEALIDLHGQTEHLSLLRPRTHVDLLDRYAGLLELRERVATQVRELRDVRRQLAELRHDARELARRIDLLQYQVEEIRAARLKPGEEEELEAERSRLANAEELMQLSEAVYTALYEGGDEQQSALDLLGQVVRDLTHLARLDNRLAELRQMAESAAYQLEDLARAARDYRDGIEFNPVRLRAVEERLDLIFRLKRKYGDSIPDILAFAARAERELETISHSEERIEELQSEEQRLLDTLSQVCGALSQARHQAVGNLAARIEAELADLRMERTRFHVSLEREEAPDGVEIDGQRWAFDTTGIDRVEFLISPNPGEPVKPLVKIASGGETSRLMLALKTVLAHADPVPTLIFDEIDAGIGGRVGEIVGRKLWGLTRPQTADRRPTADEHPQRSAVGSQPSSIQHQVLCVTHLPQLAVYGDAHHAVSKHVVGERTATRVRPVAGDERVIELSLMLGSDSAITREKAAELLRETELWKVKSPTGLFSSPPCLSPA